MTEETFIHYGLRVEIIRDEISEEPPEGDGFPIYLAHFHERHFVQCHEDLPFDDGDSFAEFMMGPEDHGDETFEKRLEEWESLRAEWHVFEVSTYIHGGIALALSGSKSFPDCRWDVSHCGAVLIRKDGEWGDDVNFEKMAQAHIKLWSQYLEGDVWGFRISRPKTCDSCGHTEYEEIDSCFGLYGMDYAKTRAREEVEMFHATWEEKISWIKDLYEARIRRILEDAEKAIEREGWESEGIIDMHDEDFRWALCVRPKGTTEDDDLVDITFEISEQVTYENDDRATGVTFRIDVVEYGGAIKGGLAPGNYTDDCWIDVTELERLEERFKIFEADHIAAEIAALATEK